jgi:hypothetical protein
MVRRPERPGKQAQPLPRGFRWAPVKELGLPNREQIGGMTLEQIEGLMDKAERDEVALAIIKGAALYAIRERELPQQGWMQYLKEKWGQSAEWAKMLIGVFITFHRVGPEKRPTSVRACVAVYTEKLVAARLHSEGWWGARERDQVARVYGGLSQDTETCDFRKRWRKHVEGCKECQPRFAALQAKAKAALAARLKEAQDAQSARRFAELGARLRELGRHEGDLGEGDGHGQPHPAPQTSAAQADPPKVRKGRSKVAEAPEPAIPLENLDWRQVREQVMGRAGKGEVRVGAARLMVCRVSRRGKGIHISEAEEGDLLLVAVPKRGE